MKRRARINPVNRERRDRMRRDEHGHVFVYGEYHRWVSELPCMIGRGCLFKPVGHHLRKASVLGDHANEVPLCVQHHTEVHNGRAKFERKYDVDLGAHAAHLARLWEQLKAA